MSSDLVEIWVEAVACDGESVCIAEGFDAEREHITFAAEPGMVDAIAQAINRTHGPVLTAVPESTLLSRGRLIMDADAMVVPRFTVPDGHWFG